MAHSLTRFTRFLAIPLAGAVMLAAAADAHAQSARAGTRAAERSAVAQGAANGAAATQKQQRAGSVALDRRAVPRHTGAIAAAPVALALEKTGPAPASTPEPISMILIGGALAGLYGIRRHLS